MIPYLLHASAMIALLYGGYRLFLSKETFFGLHRWILLAGIALAFLLPQVSIPEAYSLKEYVRPQQEMNVTAAQPQSYTQSMALEKNPASIGRKEDQKAVSKEETILPPKIETKEKSKAAAEVTVVNTSASPTSKSVFSNWNITKAMAWVYGLGCVGLLGFLLFQIVSLLRLKRHGKTSRVGRYTIVEHDVCDQSFSFGRTIYIHKSADQQMDREHIIRHEKIHARQLHSVDILLGELLTIVLWFNPFAWMYKKAIKDNLEFLTDRQMLDEGTDMKAYQMSLVRITVPHTLSQLRQPTPALALANNYNHSTLKQRIIMMNKKYSSYSKIWKVAILAPMLGLSMSAFNQVIANDQVSEEATEQIEQKKSNTEKASEKSVSKAIEKSIKANPHPVAAPIVDVDVSQPLSDIINTNLEITTPIVNEVITQVTGEMSNLTLEISDATIRSVEGMTSHIISGMMESAFEEGEEVSGRWEIETNDGMECLYFWIRKKGWNSQWTECDFDISSLPTGEFENHSIQREAGTFQLSGERNGNEGDGKFSFTTNETFRKYIEDQGMGRLNDMEMMHVFQANINTEYIQFVKSQGLELDHKTLTAFAVHHIDKDELNDKISALKKRGIDRYDEEDILAMSIHGVDGEYMDEIDGMGYNDTKVEGYIAMRIHDVDPDFVNALKEAGFDNLEADEVIGMAIHDVNEGYINELAEAGLTDLDPNEIVNLAIHDVDADFIKEVRSLGYESLDLDDIIGFAIHDVDEEFVRGLKEVGYDDLDAREITEFAIHDVDPEFIKEIKEAGFESLSNRDIVQFAIHDVDVDFISELSKAGYTDLDAREITEFAIHDVDVDFIQAVKSLGYDDLSQRDIINAAIHDVDADYLEELASAGVTDIPFDRLVNFAIHDIDADLIVGLKESGLSYLSYQDYINASIHDVEVDFIKEIQALGFNDLDIDELVNLRIHDIDVRDIEKAMKEETEKKSLRYYSRKLRRDRW